MAGLDDVGGTTGRLGGIDKNSWCYAPIVFVGISCEVLAGFCFSARVRLPKMAGSVSRVKLCLAVFRAH